MKPLFSLNFTILLGIALGFPYIMSNSTFEPYPAILLPSGASKINIKKGVITVRNLSIYGYDSQGKLQRIDVSKFLAPIPVQYLYSITKNEFGLSTKKNKNIYIRGIGEVKIDRKAITPKNQRLAKIWLSNKLNELGLLNSSFLIRHEVKKIETNSGKEISSKIIKQKNVSLR